MCKLKRPDEVFGQWKRMTHPIAERDGRDHDASQTLEGKFLHV
jgi:hypothetical protein